MEKDNLSTEPQMRNRFHQFDINGMTILEAFTRLTELMTKYGKDAKIEVFAEGTSFDAGWVIMRVVYKTKETEKEILYRITGETNRRKNQEKIDRQKYEYLKKKFADDKKETA